MIQQSQQQNTFDMVVQWIQAHITLDPFRSKPIVNPCTLVHLNKAYDVSQSLKFKTEQSGAVSNLIHSDLHFDDSWPWWSWIFLL